MKINGSRIYFSIKAMRISLFEKLYFKTIMHSAITLPILHRFLRPRIRGIGESTLRQHVLRSCFK
jgi:hypothetical protein